MRTRLLQVILALVLLASAGVIAIGFGHGGFLLWQIVLFSPLIAVVVSMIVVAMLAVAWKARTALFTVVATVFAAFLLVPAGLMILFDGPALVLGVTTLPLLTIWALVITRGLFFAWQHRADAT